MPGHCTVQSALIAQQHCRWQAADDEDDDAAGEYVMKAPSVVENSRLSGLCHATTTTTTNPSVLSAVPAAATYRPCGDQLLQLQLPLFLLLLCRRRQLSALSSFLLSYFGAAVALTHSLSLSLSLSCSRFRYSSPPSIIRHLLVEQTSSSFAAHDGRSARQFFFSQQLSTILPEINTHSFCCDSVSATSDLCLCVFVAVLGHCTDH